MLYILVLLKLSDITRSKKNWFFIMLLKLFMSNIPDIHKEKRYKPTISRIEKNINANRNKKK